MFLWVLDSERQASGFTIGIIWRRGKVSYLDKNNETDEASVINDRMP
jgi:hypothetical protein